MENKFKPFDKVLVRTSSNRVWRADFYERYDEERKCHRTMGYVTGEVVLFEGNEHLLGTTDDYVEPFVPKDGDFVVIITKASEWLSIWKEERSHDIYTYGDLDTDGYIHAEGDLASSCEIKSIRLATEEQKQTFLDKLHEQGKDWDAEKKKIVDYKWRPKEGETYYGISFNVETLKFDCYFAKWRNTPYERLILEKGWVVKNSNNSDTIIENILNRLNEAIKNVK